jgi:hypothetical protein
MGLGGKKSPGARAAREISASSIDVHSAPKENAVHACALCFERDESFHQIREKGGFELESIFREKITFEAVILEKFFESHFGLINGASRRFWRE